MPSPEEFNPEEKKREAHIKRSRTSPHVAGEVNNRFVPLWNFAWKLRENMGQEKGKEWLHTPNSALVDYTPGEVIQAGRVDRADLALDIALGKKLNEE